MSFDVCGSKLFDKENKIFQYGSQHMYWFEKFRIESFTCWPVPYIDVRELAKNGFYYIRINDAVQCAFCQVLLNNWEADDTVEFEHKKWSSGCPFVRGKSNK